jgi:hypothetical protein
MTGLAKPAERQLLAELRRKTTVAADGPQRLGSSIFRSFGPRFRYAYDRVL